MTNVIRQARSEDLPALRSILRESPEAAQWSDDALSGTLHHCLVAEIEGAAAGFLLYLPIPPDDAELLNIAVALDSRRVGVATGLITALTAQFNGSVFLEVRASNLAARRLYESLGFSVTTVRPGYYHSPVENAYVMKRTCEI